MTTKKCYASSGWLVIASAMLVTTAVYWQGLYGSWLFDDYPNIVDNHDLQIADARLASIARAALSSPSSEFKRPLASLSFATNYLISGLDPFSWKLTNLAIHLLNGLLVFLLSRHLLLAVEARPLSNGHPTRGEPPKQEHDAARTGIVAALIAAGWMLMPINLTGVLYVVQRMESLANLFVLLGLLGYVVGRQGMLAGRRGLWLCVISIVLGTATGVLAKETAIMLPLYAFLIECLVFRFAAGRVGEVRTGGHRGLQWLFALVLALPLVVGLAWLMPGVLKASAWATRDFTLGSRLLSEARIVSDYVVWTLLPTPGALSFYHDDFRISTGVFHPWTTLTSIAFLAALAAFAWMQRRRRTLVALGLALYLGCHLLTGSILPLELVYEHRNYFASFGLLLAVVPWLAGHHAHNTDETSHSAAGQGTTSGHSGTFMLARGVLLGGLLVLWTTETAFTASAWGNPLRLAQELAARAPSSPRAQYELGRTYIIYSHYDPRSPFTRLAYAPLERAMKLPESSILPEQALIFMNARMGLPVKGIWWDSMISKLEGHEPGVQDESSLGALTQCARDKRCDLSKQRMTEAFLAALAHPHPSARLLATYGEYAWDVLDDHTTGLRMLTDATMTAPAEPAYHITLARMLAAEGSYALVQKQVSALQSLNTGGRLKRDIAALEALIPEASGR